MSELKNPSVITSCDSADDLSVDNTTTNRSQRPTSDGGEKAIEIKREPYLTGWRLSLSVTGLMFSMFLAVLEASIVSTALVGITNDLQDFALNAWVINAYLITFTGFLLIWVQFSHVVGRKSSLLLSFCIFIAFSAGCAGARTSMELVVFRAFQGIGGAGVSNISTAVLVEAVPQTKLPKYIAMVSIVFAIGFASGPLIAGAIVSNITWRWVFWVNVPSAAVALTCLMIGLPQGFPNHHGQDRTAGWRASIKRLDFLGACLLLSGAVLLVTALQGGDIDWHWSSATSISLFVFSGASFVLFTAWERFITNHRPIVPILTWKFCNRKTIALFASFCLTSFPFTSSTVMLVERFQIVYGLDPLQAGIRILPFIAVVPVVSFAAAIIVAKREMRHTYPIIFGVLLQLAGIICFITATPGSTDGIPARIYGFQVLLAAGLGINNTLLTTAVPFIVDKPLAPSAMGAGMQFRYLGGALGLGVMAAVFDGKLKSGLAALLEPAQVTTILQSTEVLRTLSPQVQMAARECFLQAFQMEWKVLIAFVAMEVPLALALL